MSRRDGTSGSDTAFNAGKPSQSPAKADGV